jgi:hypothetical protein
MNIPENDFSYSAKKPQEIKVVKIQEPPSIHSKIIRNPEKPLGISYDDILNKMGVCVVNGKLHFAGEYSKTKVVNANSKSQNQIQNQSQASQKVPIQVSPQNSYIYNKYFKNELKEESIPKKPQTAIEYRNMLIQAIIEKERIKRIKSRQLFVTNIDNSLAHRPQMSETQLNKLFSFSNHP